MVGLYVFFYSTLHLLCYLGLDYQFAWNDIQKDIIKHRYVLVGFLSWILLIPLAVTSTDKMVNRLKQSWKKIHYLIYAVAPLVIFHFVWLVKKDITEPLLYGAILLLLLILRINFEYIIKYWLNNMKSKF